MLKLGKLPARPDAVKFKLENYLTVLPKTPASVKAKNLDWQMLGNDNYGDCVFAGAGHETMAWNDQGGHPVSFTDKSVLSDYSAVTGFNPNDPNSDQGTDMQVAASYRRKTGILDAQGIRHKVAAYIALSTSSRGQLKSAIYLFGAVGIGIRFPSSAMTQFNQGKNWTVVKSSPIEGGHYVPAIGYDAKYVYLVTWGKLIKATWGFISTYMDEGNIYLSGENMVNGKTITGFNLDQLKADLAAL